MCILPVQLEEELQRIGCRRHVQIEDSCRQLLAGLPLDHSLAVLREVGISDSPLQQLLPLLRSVAQSRFAGGSLVHEPIRNFGQEPRATLSGVTWSFGQLGVKEQQQPGGRLTAEVDKLLRRVGEKRQTTVDASCIQQVSAIAPEDALSVLQSLERSSAPINKLAPYLAKCIESHLRDKAPERMIPEPSSWRVPANSPTGFPAKPSTEEQLETPTTPHQGSENQSRIPLSQKVEQAVRYICLSRKLKVSDGIRQELATLGDENALYLLTVVDGTKDIRSLNSLISYHIKNLKFPPLRSNGGLSMSKDVEGEVWFETEEDLDEFEESNTIRNSFVESSDGSHLHTRHLPEGKKKVLLTEEQRTLGTLEFRKRTLVLQLTANDPSLLTTHDLEEFRSVPVDKEEAFLRTLASRLNLKWPADMTKNITLSRENILSIHECFIDNTGHCTYKGRTPVPATTALLRTLGDRLLLVRFENLPDSNCELSMYQRILERGIPLGLRHYEYFIHKDPKSKKENMGQKLGSPSVKCYFVSLTSFATADSDVSFMGINNVGNLRNYFCHVQTTSDIAKFIARLQLLLSKTVQAPIDLSEVEDVESDIEYEDSNGRVSCATDGAGQISADLAVHLPTSIIKGQSLQHLSGLKEDFPLLSQVRGFVGGMAFKGTLLAVTNLKNTVKFRKSMRKVSKDPTLRGLPCFNSLEVVTTSRKPKEATVSKELIMLLSHRHVPNDYFLKLASNFVDDVKHNYADRDRVMKEYKDMEGGTKVGDEVYRMVCAGMDPAKDIYLRESLKTLAKWKLRDFRKFRLPMPKSWFLMGTADPTGTLEHDQIALILDDGPIVCNKVLVYKHPGLHPGDIRVKVATWNPALEAVIPANARRNAIIFSTKGPWSAPEEISTSDLDGDMFWICTNPELTTYVQPCQPYRRKEGAKNHTKRPADMAPTELERALQQEFLIARFRSRYLTLTDEQGQEKEEIEQIINEIVDCHQQAVDSEKTGVQVTIPKGINAGQLPHYVENKASKPVYHSTSIIGKIYDMIDAPATSISTTTGNVYIDPDFEFGDFERHMKCWQDHFGTYRMKMEKILKSNHPSRDDECDNLFAQYRKELYGGETLKAATKPLNVVLSEASAVYKVVYGHALMQDIRNERMDEMSRKQDLRVRFAWGVALHALCMIYAYNQPGQPVIHASKAVRQRIVLDD